MVSFEGALLKQKRRIFLRSPRTDVNTPGLPKEMHHRGGKRSMGLALR